MVSRISDSCPNHQAISGEILPPFPKFPHLLSWAELWGFMTAVVIPIFWQSDHYIQQVSCREVRFWVFVWGASCWQMHLARRFILKEMGRWGFIRSTKYLSQRPLTPFFYEIPTGLYYLSVA